MQRISKRLEILKPLIYLDEKIGPRALNVLVPKLDEHLGDASDRAHGVDRIVLPAGIRVSAQTSAP